MFTKTTPCGRTVMFSDCDYDIVKDMTIYYEKGSRTITYGIPGLQKKNGAVLPLLFKTSGSQKYGYIYADGNRFNLQRENVTQVPRAIAFRYRKPVCGKKYKGVRSIPYKKYYKRWFASVWIDRDCYMWLEANSEISAAGLYNAMCDYFQYEGYRNNVPQIVLTNEHKKHIEKILLKWKNKYANTIEY